MFEVLQHFMPKVKASQILSKLSLEKGKYFVVSAHREENISSPKNFANLISVLNAIETQFDMPVIVSTHPRTQRMIEQQSIQFNSRVHLMKPFGLTDYIALQASAKAVLSDSGTITEESSILNFPALNIREAHERPEGMEEAAVIMVGLNPERVMQGLKELDSHPAGQRVFRQVGDYSMPNVSDKIVRIILSYTDYVKRVVWSE
jgi:UDP-N-acetylglucosamine 2-epimerase (non-hydrolysing)